ncbi:GNAT family N-acetyltransferase [Algoriphagus sp. D3-2-R+10]|uniref:GNAT family N-acetyltransferase n=1 Tax=Algoriphagus aurantiacus TaxID=3103948 RepID=UPI002B3C8545|nr:GNAT family N-acetyltransferase [Algoriphagus sp. D3-2-R+10]MEB2775331.1 GNAT family N-acetyltransferase [Algoriphagus sp. D3-2-R+10]
MERETIIKPFEELSIHELYAIIRLRNEVFVVEQNCIFQDADNKDQLAFHVMIKAEGLLVAYARILPAGASFAEVSIGRVVSDIKARRTGAGRRLMKDSLSFILDTYGPCIVRIGAQTYLNAFYKSLGFEDAGETYLEDGIEHIEMTTQV